MARRVILSPQRIDGWLQSFIDAAIAAAAAGLEAEISGRVEGALAVDKNGRVMLVSKLAADLSPEGLATLTGGAPVGVEGELEVGWDQETKVGRMAWGWCECRVSTRKAAA